MCPPHAEGTGGAPVPDDPDDLTAADLDTSGMSAEELVEAALGGRKREFLPDDAFSAPWSEALEHVAAAYRRASELEVAKAENEYAPFAERYVGEALCESAERLLDRHRASQVPGPDEAAWRGWSMALATRRGSLMLLAEDQSASEGSLTRALEVVSGSDEARCEFNADLVELYNNLGLLWSSRGEFGRAGGYLNAAERRYPLKTGIGTSRTLQEASNKLEYCFTQTLFYQAQVLGSLGDEVSAARYCARTLQRQLEGASQSKLDACDWSQNAAQLAGSYVGRRQWAAAETLLLAAQKVLASSPTHENDEWHVVEVGANIHIGRGRYYLARLTESRERKRPLSKDLEETDSVLPDKDGGVAEAVDFPTLKLDREGCETYLAHTWASALPLFKRGRWHMDRAMDYYELDGFVTEHVETKLDLCRLYRQVAGFEDDPHRRCVMHKKRCRILEPILKELNAEKFPGLWMSAAFECAEGYRCIADVKAAAAWPHARVAAAALKSADWYGKFVDKRHGLSKSAAEPVAEQAREVMTARLLRGQMFARAQHDSGKDLAPLTAAVKEYEWIVGYADKQGTVDGFQAETNLAREMMELLPEKLNRLKVKAAEEGGGK